MRLVPFQLPIRAAALGSSSSRPALSFPWRHGQQLSSPLALAGAGGPAGNMAAAAVVEGRRHASVKSQGAYKLKMKKTLPKKLGCKRTGDQYVIPGTIIYKQRGTIWHPGENTILGRDHTIHAAVAGYVKYYRDPARHPDRQYIGVVFDKSDKLPYPPNAERRRKLGMVAVQRKEPVTFEPVSRSGIPRKVIRKEGIVAAPREEDATEEEAATAAEDGGEGKSADGSGKKESKATRAARRWNEYIKMKRSNRVLYLRKDYSYLENNSAIGRLMGKHRGKTPGTIRYGSRHGVLRARRRRREQARAEQRKLEQQARMLAAERTRIRKEDLAEMTANVEKMKAKGGKKKAPQ